MAAAAAALPHCWRHRDYGGIDKYVPIIQLGVQRKVVDGVELAEVGRKRKGRKSFFGCWDLIELFMNFFSL
jgi:hypothetical protein